MREGPEFKHQSAPSFLDKPQSNRGEMNGKNRREEKSEITIENFRSYLIALNLNFYEMPFFFVLLLIMKKKEKKREM